LEVATMIGEICSKPAVTAVADTTAQEAAHRMATKRVGALVVVDRDGRPRGVVTDRDITIHVVAAGKDPAEVQLGSLLHRRPVVIREDAGILDATKKLAQRGVRRLPVVNSGGKVVGIISLDDLMILLGSELGHVASTLASELGRAIP
jgi:CBS domain-containing protein